MPLKHMKVSDFKLVDPARERARLIQTIESLNRTAHPYDRNRGLHEVLLQNMRAGGDAVAVAGEDLTLTYSDLLALSGRIASWLGTFSPRVAGVMMENTPEMMAAILGTLRAGAVYLPINPELPLDRIRAMLVDTGTEALFTERKFAREANRLQWECPALTHLMCLDSDDFREEEESASELSRIDLWEYVGEEATDAISGGGWKNSYTGQDLSAEIMREYAENTYSKLGPLLTRESRVLEIGCSTGLTMFRLAPECGLYYGIDFSKTILAKTRAEAERLGLTNIRLDLLAAHDVDRVAEGDFDLVVINSVAQNFNGHNYLRRVLLKAVRLLKPEGRIFLGDLMDQDRKEALFESLVEFQRAHAGKGFTTKTDWSAELFVSRDWIEDMCVEFPGAASAEHSEKIRTIPNELTEFRFDSLISISRDEKPAAKRERRRHQASRPELESHGPDPMPARVPPEQPAYVIYTSGTTGKPKGVAVSHRSIHNYVQWAARYYYAGGGGNMALFTSPAFDLTLTSIFAPLYLGKSIHTFRNRDVDRLLEAVFADRGVDSIKLTPSHISILENCEIEPRAMAVGIVGGEDLTPAQVNTLRKYAPGIRIYNEYGPTEATIGCTVCLVEEPRGDQGITPPIHIGKPVDNAEIWILGSGGELKPVGAPGELCVAGDCLANGYWGDPELTDRKFVAHPVKPGGRIYRTGDLARWMPDGNLLLMGRADYQVKIRGNRIELGEIESRLRELPGVRDAVVIAREDSRGDKALCAYVIPADGRLDIPALRAGLARTLPEFLIPSYFAELAEFPLSLNGKLDRKRLPEPDEIAAARNAEYEPPSTATEQALAEIWRDVLGVSRIGARDNFFELGGHSLKATQVASRVHRALDAQLELRQVFRNQTLKAMAAAIDSSRRFRFSKIEPVLPAEDYELSHAQRRLWILQQIEKDSIAYNVHDAIEIEGPLNPDVLRAAFDALVRRHESLRTIIVSTAGGPRQKVLDDIGFSVAFSDLRRHLDAVAEAERLSQRDASEPFDLSRGPLLRVRLLRLGADLYRVLLTMHHVVSDGWSSGVMVRELLQFYNTLSSGAAPDLPPLRVQYKDYAAWQNRLLENADEHASFWRARLGGELPRLNLPTDFERPSVQAFKGASATFALPAAVLARLRALARSEQVSLFMLLNAALKALFYRLSGAQDIILGVPVAGRTHIDLEGQIGFFVNTLALRDEVRAHDGFRDLLSRVRRTTTDAFEHQVYPFDRLVNELHLHRDTSRSPLFDVMLVLHNNESPEMAVEGLRVRPVPARQQVSRFDLTFHFFEIGDELMGTVEYATSLFREERIHGFWACFGRLLESATINPSRPLAELDILPERDRARVIDEFNRTEGAWEAPLAMFRAQVAARAEQIAVVCGARSLTYRELDRRAQELAAAIRRNASRREPVAVLLDRSERNVTALLACLKAGCAYMPVDPSYPEERVAAILANSGTRLALVEGGAARKLGSFSGAICNVDDVQGGATLDESEDRIAYVIYTSGSTGLPKGVSGTTQCLGNLISWQRCAIGDGLRSAQYAALGFDVSVQEMLYSVCCGGTLLVAGNEERFDPARLRAFLDEHAIELVTMPFSGLNLLFSTQQGLEQLSNLKYLITSGEQLRLTPELRLFLERRPDVRLHNQYGPSETHVVTSHELSARSRNLIDLPPIGRPIANTRCYILDERRQPVPVGVNGELYLAGANVAEGYLNDPELTTRRFVPDPFHAGERMYQTGDLCRWRDDGEIEFLGRKDDQVKIRGYRVEPGEIEAALLATPGVRAACVAPWKTPGGQTELAAYFESNAVIDEPALRAQLGRWLPAYMVPARFIFVERMPLTPTGKVNRRALPPPDAIAKPTEPVRIDDLSATEQRVTMAFTAVLGRTHVGADDDFFQLGGHSLLAVQLAARLGEEFSTDIPLLSVFQHPTARRMAEWLDEVRDYHADHEERFFALLNENDGVPLFALPPLLGYAAAFRRLAELLTGARIYGFDFVESAEILERYESAIASLQPEGAVTLFGYSGGGNVAFELAKRMESNGRSVRLILLDSFRIEPAPSQDEDQIRRSIRLNLEYFDRHLERDPKLRVFVSNELVRAMLVRKMGNYMRYLDAIQNEGTIEGDIHIIESTEFEGDSRRDAWAQATRGSLHKHRGHGSHVDMILETHVAANAEILNRILECRRN
jgi:amino acid adenylation domain-containing protein